MTSKERVKRALAREKTDRIPVCMWFHPETRANLASILNIYPNMIDTVMGNDILMTWVNNNYAMEGMVHDQEGEGHIDSWGIEWERIGSFNQIVKHPLKEAERNEVLSYSFPTDKIDSLLSNMNPIASEEKYFIGCDVSPCVFEMYWRLRGMEQAILDMVMDEELSRLMFQRCADFAAELSTKACSRFNLDWLWTGDDVAGKDTLMMSPDTWRRLIKPALKNVIDIGKENDLPVAYHCCGALRPIIGDLIETGIDVLNPVQSNCPGMNPGELKREYGADLAFMGGVDTQGIMINGNPDDVRRYTDNLIEEMTADGGGYILAGTHTLAPETPLENIFALYSSAGISQEEIYDTASLIRNFDR
jgi:uroporphyrinogen decarboxylase